MAPALSRGTFLQTYYVRRLVWHLSALLSCGVFFATLWRLVYRLIVSRSVVLASMEARWSSALSRAMVLADLWRLVSRLRSLVHCFFANLLWRPVCRVLSLSLPFGRCKKK